MSGSEWDAKIYQVHGNFGYTLTEIWDFLGVY